MKNMCYNEVVDMRLCEAKQNCEQFIPHRKFILNTPIDCRQVYNTY